MTQEKIKIGFYERATGTGGSTRYLNQLIARIETDDYEPVLFCTRTSFERFRSLYEKAGVQPVFLSSHPCADASKGGGAEKKSFRLPLSLALMMGYVRETVRLSRIFKQNPVTTLHSMDSGCEIVPVAAKLAGIPRVLGTLHAYPAYEKKAGGFVRRVIEWGSLRFFDELIAVSQATRKAWTKRCGLPEGKIRVIYNGIDPAELGRGWPPEQGEKLKRRLGLNPGDKSIGLIGRLHPMKGHIFLLKAMKKLLSEFSDLKVFFVGEGPLEKELRDEVRRGNLEKNVFFLGYREDAVHLMGLFDVIVLPSTMLECLPYVLIEAAWLGKPAIGTQVAGIPEVIENCETGYVVPAGNAERLADAVLQILRNSVLAKKMGEQGRARAQRLFTEDRMIRETYDVYENQLREAGIRSHA